MFKWNDKVSENFCFLISQKDCWFIYNLCVFLSLQSIYFVISLVVAQNEILIARKCFEYENEGAIVALILFVLFIVEVSLIMLTMKYYQNSNFQIFLNSNLTESLQKCLKAHRQGPKSGVSKSIYMIKHVNFQLCKVHPDGIS